MSEQNQPQLMSEELSTTSPSETEPTANELLDQQAKYPTLDRFLDRNPHLFPYTRTEMLNLLENLRGMRARFFLAEQEKAGKPKAKAKKKA